MSGPDVFARITQIATNFWREMLRQRPHFRRESAVPLFPKPPAEPPRRCEKRSRLDRVRHSPAHVANPRESDQPRSSFSRIGSTTESKSASLTMRIPRHGSSTSRSGSPVTITDALLAKANSRNLSSSGSRQSRTTSWRAASGKKTAAFSQVSSKPSRAALDTYRSSFERRSTSQSSAKVALEKTSGCWRSSTDRTQRSARLPWIKAALTRTLVSKTTTLQLGFPSENTCSNASSVRPANPASAWSLSIAPVIFRFCPETKLR